MKTIDYNRPLFSLTVGEYIEFHNFLDEQKKPAQVATQNIKELLTIKEAAEFLHLSVATLYTLNSRRKICFSKISGKVYYRRSSLLKLIEDGEIKSKLQLRKEIEEGK